MPLNTCHVVMAALVCWSIFEVLAMLVAQGHTASIDDWGLLVFRDPSTLALRGSDWLADVLCDLTALGGFLLRNLAALIAVAILMTFRHRR